MQLFRRKEQKYEVGPAAALFLRQEIARRLPCFEFERGHPYTHVTTLYFDTRNRDFYRKAERSYEDNVKIRVKEYYYPLLAEAHGDGANSPVPGAVEIHGNGSRSRREASYRTSPVCYVELKQSVAGLVIKKRFGFPKKDLHLLVGGQDVWPILVKITPSEDLSSLKDVYRELLRYLSSYSVELTSIVCYRRTVYQECEEELRITFDDHLAVYQPVPELYGRAGALTPDVLGKPIRTSDKVILEVKCPGKYPSWLEKAMQYHSTRRLSKFTTSVRLILSDSDGSGVREAMAEEPAHREEAIAPEEKNGAGESSGGLSPRLPRGADPVSQGGDTQQMTGFF